MNRAGILTPIACAIMAMAQCCVVFSADEATVASPYSLECEGHVVGPIRIGINGLTFAPDDLTFAMPTDNDGNVTIYRRIPPATAHVDTLSEDQLLEVRRQIDLLGSDDYATREKATTTLKNLGKTIEQMIKEALTSATEPEAKFRLETVLEHFRPKQKAGTEFGVEKISAFRAHQQTVRAVEYSPDGKRLLTASIDGSIAMWDAETFREIYRLRVDGEVNDATFSPDGTLIAAGSGQTISVWDVETGKILKQFSGLTDEIWSIDFSPDGSQIACSGVPRSVNIWNVETEKQVRVLEGFGDSVGHLRYAPGGETLATACEDGTVKIWNAASGELIRTLEGHADEAWTVTYSPDGKLIASGGNNSDSILWEVATGRKLANIQGKSIYGGHGGYISFSPSGESMATATSWGSIWLWKIKPD